MSSRSPARRPFRAKQREAASEAILQAAEQVAVERGLEAASIAAIAERAGVAVGTLYNYFPDRDGILAALFGARRAELVPRIAAAGAAVAHLTFEPRMHAFVLSALGAFEDHRAFIKLAVEVDLALPKLKDRHPALMTQFVQSLEEIFRVGAKQKRFATDRCAIYARMLQGALKALTLWRLERGEPLTMDAALAVDTFLHGIAA